MTEAEFEQFYEDKDCLVMPECWTMPPNSVSDAITCLDPDIRSIMSTTDPVGKCGDFTDKQMALSQKESGTDHISPSESIYPGVVVLPYLYLDCLFVHNPQLFFMDDNYYDTPLWALDTQAHLILKFVTGEKCIPSMAEMKSENYNQAVSEMQMPFVRCKMDSNYRTAVFRWLSKTSRAVHYLDRSGKSCIRYEFPSEWQAAYEQFKTYLFQALGRLMYEANYPLQIVSPGEIDHINNLPQLNRIGQDIFNASSNSRCVELCSKSRITFRDITLEQCSMIGSVFTQTLPSPMTKPWLDIPDSELHDIRNFA
jgi:hypothetical protein